MPCGEWSSTTVSTNKKKNETEFEYEVKISLKAVICFFLVLQAMLV